MLTPKRHQLIEQELSKKQMVTIQDLVDITGASESTIRRDLSELEKQSRLIRVHGGASIKNTGKQELSVPEKSSKNITEKKAIAAYATGLVEDYDCIYLDAGTTTFEMIPFLTNKNITVVTNGITHLDALSQFGIPTYLVGGLVKYNTSALIGQFARMSLLNYRFDKCFLGVNGIHAEYAYTTPDPEEAAIKQTALELSKKSFVLADSSKLDQVSFTKIADLKAATIIINQTDHQMLNAINKKTNVKVVS
ncbi:DeoR/GlpR family DNA-binding transcription regulator [Paraliobacillus ryukyuensis]|uniref:DeoR/GlpR family DNA-binding transcription regulator n=1 Tax=Paraliobacillus ryukyuensis TaxID=200904 RepID=UPI0009A6EAE1|nr:DeoR/GlpR family DNA-binding transcription regulator [Paraliobacillus ryukyuensis]